MAKSELDRVTDESLAKGGILVKMYFDMQSEERDKLQPILVELINERLLKEQGVIYAYGAVEEPLQRGKYHITSATVHLMFNGLRSLFVTVFKYAPAGLEVIKPQKDLHISIWDLQSLLMDMSQLSSEYSRYILEKVMKPEDLEIMKQQMQNREELGKKLLQQKKEPEK